MNQPMHPLPNSDMPTVVSRPVQPGPIRPARRRGCYWLLGCVFIFLLPLAIVTGLVGGVFLAAAQSGRLNVLILGVDRRPDETGPTRTDTMILATFDPNQPQAALLSLPRDLWVEIPGQGPNRLNTANFFGEAAQPGSGPDLVMQTITHNFGPPVHGYVQLDFAGFVALVDALGGLEIDVPKTIVDDHYPTPDYGITTITIPAGLQHMDGETALIYARTRHADSDFERNKRQQQILRALVAKAVQPGAWPRLPAAWATVRTFFTTDLNEVDLATIFLAAVRAGPDGLETHVIEPDMTIPFTTDFGAQVLLPRWEVIWPLVHGIFGLET